MISEVSIEDFKGRQRLKLPLKHGLGLVLGRQLLLRLGALRSGAFSSRAQRRGGYTYGKEPLEGPQVGLATHRWQLDLLSLPGSLVIFMAVAVIQEAHEKASKVSRPVHHHLAGLLQADFTTRSMLAIQDQSKNIQKPCENASRMLLALPL